MRQKTLKYIFQAAVLLLAAVFILKFAGITILRLYIQAGIGDCRKIPILCVSPKQEISNPAINTEYLAGLVEYNFGEISIRFPEGFTVVKERITKVYTSAAKNFHPFRAKDGRWPLEYQFQTNSGIQTGEIDYKHKKRQHNQPAVYLLYERPGFFINLFPNLIRQGVRNNAEFLTRTMNARLTEINNLTDAFFVVMKSIFIPDLGNQKNVSMVKFSAGDRKGFINYNLNSAGNYFDCNIITGQDDFFKVYIKDKRAVLDLDKVIAIISSVKKI